MSAESAHLSTFGVETEIEAEIRSTSIAHGKNISNHELLYFNIFSAALNFDFVLSKINSVFTYFLLLSPFSYFVCFATTQVYAVNKYLHKLLFYLLTY